MFKNVWPNQGYVICHGEFLNDHATPFRLFLADPDTDGAPWQFLECSRRPLHVILDVTRGGCADWLQYFNRWRSNQRSVFYMTHYLFENRSLSPQKQLFVHLSECVRTFSWSQFYCFPTEVGAVLAFNRIRSSLSRRPATRYTNCTSLRSFPAVTLSTAGRSTENNVEATMQLCLIRVAISRKPPLHLLLNPGDRIFRQVPILFLASLSCLFGLWAECMGEEMF